MIYLDQNYFLSVFFSPFFPSHIFLSTGHECRLSISVQTRGNWDYWNLFPGLSSHSNVPQKALLLKSVVNCVVRSYLPEEWVLEWLGGKGRFFLGVDKKLIENR